MRELAEVIEEDDVEGLVSKIGEILPTYCR